MTHREMLLELIKGLKKNLGEVDKNDYCEIENRVILGCGNGTTASFAFNEEGKVINFKIFDGLW